MYVMRYTSDCFQSISKTVRDPFDVRLYTWVSILCKKIHFYSKNYLINKRRIPVVFSEADEFHANITLITYGYIKQIPIVLSEKYHIMRNANDYCIGVCVCGLLTYDCKKNAGIYFITTDTSV